MDGCVSYIFGGIMVQNTSSAVMQQRKEPHDSLDFFPTPPWATRALCEYVIGEDNPYGENNLIHKTAKDPACGEGHMARPLGEYFKGVEASDIFDYGYGQVDDYLFQDWHKQSQHNWTITNPPFRLALQFIMQALDNSSHGVAMFVRTSFLEGIDRHKKLFSKYPPAIVAQFCERVILHKGIVRDPSKLYWNEKTKKMQKPSSATSYCWIVWKCGPMPKLPPQFMWIPKCRTLLEKPGDYKIMKEE